MAIKIQRDPDGTEYVEGDPAEIAEYYRKLKEGSDDDDSDVKESTEKGNKRLLLEELRMIAEGGLNLNNHPICFHHCACYNCHPLFPLQPAYPTWPQPQVWYTVSGDTELGMIDGVKSLDMDALTAAPQVNLGKA